MTWIEMSRNEDHGGGSWAFTQALWSPTRKRNGHRWTFWETVGQVSKGDTVLHLRGIGEAAAFVGYSQAASNGFISSERPPILGQWNYAAEFYRVHLEAFTPFPAYLPLQEVFAKRDALLRDYFLDNAAKPRGSKEPLFYVIQTGRIQCLNGAYLSYASPDLIDILLVDVPFGSPAKSHTPLEVATSFAVRQLKTRSGQDAFSHAVRQNYACSCCFPGCNVTESPFLIGAHIARWADKPTLRGSISNGLCLCLMHDKAFETGLFTLDLDYKVWSSSARLKTSRWAEEHIRPAIGRPIRSAPILPSHEALLEHWERVALYPER